MSRADTVTQDAVNAACEALVARNIKPTIEGVRGEVGGSYSTLSPMLKVWRASKQAESAAVFDMPDPVLTGARTFAAELWKIASTEARRRTEAVEAAADERATVAEAEASELAAVVRSLEQELETATGEQASMREARDAAESARQEAESRATRQEAELAALRTQLERAEAQHAELQTELIALARAGVSGKGKSSE